MNWSLEQSAIFDYFRDGKGNAIVTARAGTGKTTTIKEAFQFAPEARILYAVFNKRNQKEAQEKISDNRVDVRTLHSLGFAFIKRVWPSAKPDIQVEIDRAVAVSPALSSDHEMRGLILKLVGFAKNCTTNTTQADLARLADQLDLQFDGIDGVGIAMRILEASKVKDAQHRISFDDMVWLPVVMGWVRPWYDLVCIDEAQDMSLPQLTMARSACKPGGRVVVVGDDRQAIYAFRGAVQNGMSMMRVTLRAKSFGLTVTYRCPKKVVELAAKYVPDYKAAPEAPDGIVEVCSTNFMRDQAKVGDAILSRLNAPLMPVALALLRKNVPARIEGRDIGSQLISVLRSMRAKDVPQLLQKLRAWGDKQTKRLTGSKNADKKIEQINDIVETLSAISQDAKGVMEIEVKLRSLFDDTETASKPAVVLSSVHKAKGLEWSRVFLLSETFRANKGGEEENIYYVALTRSKSHLYLVGASNEKNEDEKLPEKRVTQTKAPVEIDTWEIPRGCIRRQVGDVIRHEGKEFVVVRVSASCAKAENLVRTSKSVTNRVSGETATFQSGADVISINTVCEPGDVIRRIPFNHSSTHNLQPHRAVESPAPAAR